MVDSAGLDFPLAYSVDVNCVLSSLIKLISHGIQQLEENNFEAAQHIITNII